MKTTTFTLTDRIYAILCICLFGLWCIFSIDRCSEFEPQFAYVSDVVEPIDSTEIEWEVFYSALCIVESRGDSLAIGANNDKGIIQITKVYLKQVNKILGYKKYSLEDRFSAVKSREMFDIYQAHFNPDKDIDRAIKLHNPRAGQWYSNKIKKQMEIIKNSGL